MGDLPESREERSWESSSNPFGGSGNASGRTEPVDPDAARLERGDLIVLIGTTTRVLDDCRIANGALVVAPSQLPSYPVGALDGMVCRPGEVVALAILAMDCLGRNERNSLLAWLTHRAAGFTVEGYLRRTYAIHGRVTDRRPDRSGTALLLAAICARPERCSAEPVRAIIRQLAAGLALGRDRRQTSPSPTVDLAESGLSAMALHGVSAILPADEWERAAVREDERRDALIEPVLALLGSDPVEVESGGSVLPGRHDARNGPRRLFPDDGTEQAALVALSWVPGIDPGLRTIVIDHLISVLMPEDSELEGRVSLTDLFWLSIALERAGRSVEAGELFSTTMDLADTNGHFPEFNSMAPSAEPAAVPALAAHLMFVVAAGILGRLHDLPRSGFTSSRRRP